MRISDWSSDVCSSDLLKRWRRYNMKDVLLGLTAAIALSAVPLAYGQSQDDEPLDEISFPSEEMPPADADSAVALDPATRSEEHTSELQSLMRISYAVFCLKKKQNTRIKHQLLQYKTIKNMSVQN